MLKSKKLILKLSFWSFSIISYFYWLLDYLGIFLFGRGVEVFILGPWPPLAACSSVTGLPATSTDRNVIEKLIASRTSFARSTEAPWLYRKPAFPATLVAPDFFLFLFPATIVSATRAPAAVAILSSIQTRFSESRMYLLFTIILPSGSFAWRDTRTYTHTHTHDVKKRFVGGLLCW